MFGTSSFTVSLLNCGAVAALLCSMAALGSNPARAQTATNLNCNKCVDTGEIAKKAVTKSRIKKNAVKENRLSKDLQGHVAERESFYITLDGNGSTETIATHGTLSYFARCLVNQPDGGGGFEDKVEIVVTSTEAGWFEDDESSNPNGGNVPLNAGQQIIAHSETVNPTGGSRYDNFVETSAMAPDGSYLALEGDSSGIGLNTFGHDCVVVGNIYRLTGIF